MGKWVKDRLDSFCHIEMGQSPDSSGYNSEGVGLPLIQGNADIKNRKTIKRNFTSIITKTSLPGEIILTVRAPVGNVAVATDECCLGRGVCAISSSNVDKHFLYHALIWRESEWQKLEQGSTFTAVGYKEVESFSIEYPILENEQRHIAEILTTCDEVIEKSEAVAEKYRAIKAGMLKDLFTRGIGKNGKLRPPPESSPQLYKDTALGKVPREWEVKSFDSAFELHGNNTLSRAFLTNQNGVVRNVHYGDVLVKYDTILDCDDEALPSVIAEGLRQAGSDYLQNGDLVFADTAEDDTVGKAVELYNVGDRTIVSGLHTIFARPKEDDFASRWLGYYVNSDSFHKQLLPFVVGSKVSSISRTNIKRTFVVIPESDEQQQIAERLSAIDAKIAHELAVIAKYRKVKAGLMARLLTPPDMEVE